MAKLTVIGACPICKTGRTILEANNPMLKDDSQIVLQEFHKDCMVTLIQSAVQNVLEGINTKN
jgi:hypothetical protein